MKARPILLCGLAFMLCGVMLGAFGAHMLKARITPDLPTIWHTGVEYQFYHALGLIGLGIWAQYRLDESKRAPQGVTLSAVSFIVGILLFSGSLYLMALSGYRWLGMVTPFGGVAFLLGWCAWIIAAWRTR